MSFDVLSNHLHVVVRTRPDNKGCLPLTLDDYLKLLDWTGRQLRTEKRGSIPAACAPILDRLDCSEES